MPSRGSASSGASGGGRGVRGTALRSSTGRTAIARATGGNAQSRAPGVRGGGGKDVGSVAPSPPEENSLLLNDATATKPVLRGASVAFTGELDGLTRENAEDKVKTAGARVMSGVSGNTDFLIVGSHLDDGRAVEETSKYRKYLEIKAKGKKCPRLVREPELMALLGDATISESNSARTPKVQRAPTLVALGAEGLPWVDRYAPQRIEDLLGNASSVKKLAEWLRDWDDVVLRGKTKPPRFKPGGGRPENLNARAALVSGPPGIGKTSACRLVSKLRAGYEVLEYNASDSRGQKVIQAMAAGIADNRTLPFGTVGGSDLGLRGMATPALTKRTVIIMDEVDGMSAGDRGGVAALIKMIKHTKNPVMCICNDHSNPKIRNLAFSCYEIRFSRPSKTTIAERAAQIGSSEGLDIEPLALEALAESAGNDVRQVVNQLQMLAKCPEYRQVGVGYMDMKERLREIRKDSATMCSPFEACKDLLVTSIVKQLTVGEALDRFFVDYNLLHLLVQENYLNAVKTKKVDTDLLECCAASASHMADGDIISRQIRDGHWALLPAMGLVSTVLPAKVTNGFVAFPEFPKFLGNWSKQSRARRLCLELSMYFRLASTVSKNAIINSGYMHLLLRKAMRLLQEEDVDGAVAVLDAYGLQRSHLAEHLSELAEHLCGEDEFKLVDPKVKAALTRELNTGVHALRVVLPTSRKRRAVVPEGDELGEADNPTSSQKGVSDIGADGGAESDAAKSDDEAGLGGLVRKPKARRKGGREAKPMTQDKSGSRTLEVSADVTLPSDVLHTEGGVSGKARLAASKKEANKVIRVAQDAQAKAKPSPKDARRLVQNAMKTALVKTKTSLVKAKAKAVAKTKAKVKANAKVKAKAKGKTKAKMKTSRTSR
eukprot:TRINITY_DN22610_c0_g1_i1.p1 TRINITY_DN22610_c0_g1~~TRINITY_DN22610_c0_g1_i1.p1  ORF type:complete len:887 (+),score=159.86 TRINITY_DN22610_c0_g1_i1:72-2732(+)